MPSTAPLDAPPHRAPRMYGLDLIRGFAILLVLLRHAWPEIFGMAGIVGVVVFFALSGYLITGVLDRDIKESGKVRYGRFYLHRFFRLVPPLALMLAGFALVEGIWNILGDRENILHAVIVGMTYTTNIPGVDDGSAAMGHLWTLATEEQFYLLWPLVLVLVLRWKRSASLAVAGAIALLIICAMTIVVAAPDVHRVYTLPTSWFAAMLVGAAGYLAREHLAAQFTLRGRARPIAPCIALVGLLLISIAPDLKNWGGTYLLIAPAISILTLVLILESTRWKGVAPTAVSPLLWLGKISYAAYLWNYPIATWMGDRPFSILQGVLTIFMTLVIAAISWHLVELPSAQLRRRIDSRRELAKAAKLVGVDGR